MAIEDVSMITDDSFQQVAKLVGSFDGSVSFAQKAQFYGLYKRATQGRLVAPYTEDDIDTETRPASRPGMLNPTGRSKYDAWLSATNDVGSREDAKVAYVKLAEEIVGEPVREALK